MMTEDEAKTKWCPHVRLTLGESGTDVSWNRIFQNDGSITARGCNCIASQCMSWRSVVNPHPNCSGIPHGYCGLAGAP